MVTACVNCWDVEIMTGRDWRWDLGCYFLANLSPGHFTHTHTHTHTHSFTQEYFLSTIISPYPTIADTCRDLKRELEQTESKVLDVKQDVLVEEHRKKNLDKVCMVLSWCVSVDSWSVLLRRPRAQASSPFSSCPLYLPSRVVTMHPPICLVRWTLG